MERACIPSIFPAIQPQFAVDYLLSTLGPCIGGEECLALRRRAARHQDGHRTNSRGQLGVGEITDSQVFKMMVSSWSLRFLVVNLAIAIGYAGRPSQGWKDGKFKTLVTFGDSYTDENRLGYFINNNGSTPPVGWQQPVVC